MASSSTTLEKLIAQINASPVYQRMTSEQIAAEANRRYQSEYDQKRQSARQAYETSDAALSRQIAALSAAYNKQRLQSEQQNRQTYAQADRQALGRGMQRSSYNNANLTNIAMAGDAALRAITQAQTDEENDLNSQRSLLSQQLASQLAQYDQSQRSDTLSYIDQLESREYDRWLESTRRYNELTMQLYEYQRELEEAELEQERWQAEFDAKYGGSGGGGGGGGGSRRRTETQSAKTNTAQNLVKTQKTYTPLVTKPSASRNNGKIVATTR